MKMTRRLLAAMLICCSIQGCVTRARIIPANKVVERLEAGKPFSPISPGYFVPDARMKEILDRLAEKEVFGE